MSCVCQRSILQQSHPRTFAFLCLLVRQLSCCNLFLSLWICFSIWFAVCHHIGSYTAPHLRRRTTAVLHRSSLVTCKTRECLIICHCSKPPIKYSMVPYATHLHFAAGCVRHHSSPLALVKPARIQLYQQVPVELGIIL